MDAVLDDGAHRCDSSPWTDTDDGRGGTWELDEALLEANAEFVPGLEVRKPGGADASPGDLEERAILNYCDAELDAAWVRLNRR